VQHSANFSRAIAHDTDFLLRYVSALAKKTLGGGGKKSKKLHFEVGLALAFQGSSA
jgi:hypothetical protein